MFKKMAKVTLTIEIDSLVNDELDYIVHHLVPEEGFGITNKIEALQYLCEAWATAGRRSGSWERGCFQSLGLIPNCYEFDYYRQYYGDPATVRQRYEKYCQETGQEFEGISENDLYPLGRGENE